jgi:hypothetical protein
VEIKEGYHTEVTALGNFDDDDDDDDVNINRAQKYIRKNIKPLASERLRY